MEKVAMIKNGIVSNIALWDGNDEWSPFGFILVDVTNIECGVGYVYINGTFIPPEVLN